MKWKKWFRPKKWKSKRRRKDLWQDWRFLCAFGIAVFIGGVVFYENCSPVVFSKAGNSNTEIDDDGNCTGAECPDPVNKVLALGLLTRNMACVMCHTRIHGNTSGFGTMIFRDDSSGEIIGNIYAADIKLQKFLPTPPTFPLDTTFIDQHTDVQLLLSVLPELAAENTETLNGQVVVKRGEKHNTLLNIDFAQGDFYSLTHHDANKRPVAQANLIFNPFTQRPIIHEADFPQLDPSVCTTRFGRIVTADGTVHQNPINGNVVFVRGQRVTPSASTPANAFSEYDVSCPANQTLTIEGEVVINGDLVISGCVKGQGTLYATGNIYIPNDIKMKASAFPFPLTVNDDTLKQDVFSKADRDMLSLGARQFIMIGNIHPDVINHVEQDEIFRNNQGIYKRIYGWFGGGEAVYVNSFLKKIFGRSELPGAVALVEANLYANMGIASTLIKQLRSNIVINGSIATPNLSLLSSGFFNIPNGTGPNPFNGITYQESRLNQDFRLKYTPRGFECHRIRPVN